MKARLMDSPADYEKLHINPNQIEVWEDSRRNPDTGAGNWEWWYFDAILDDGTKVVIQFFTKAGMVKVRRDGDSPSVTLKITTPDGTLYQREVTVKQDKAFYGKEKCDVRFGNNILSGDLENYSIFVEPKKGVGANLKLKSLAKPYRPGTAYFEFGEGHFFTWLCAVPAGEVSGTITLNGKEMEVHGRGYHDHQWGNPFSLTEWNSWLWGRQSFDDYSVLIFDFVGAEHNGFERFPILFIQDKNGEIVFENRKDVVCRIEEEYTDNEASGKTYPRKLHYEFANQGKKLIYELNGQQVLEAQGSKKMPLPARWVMKKFGVNLSYLRYSAKGSMTFTTQDGTVKDSGNLIFEFMYPGSNYRKYMEK